MYGLHNLHGQLVGIHIFILRLNISRFVESFTSYGKMFHILGPRDFKVQFHKKQFLDYEYYKTQIGV